MENKKLLSEIKRNKELMGIFEKYEDLPIINDTYPCVDFHSRTKQDRLNPDLLKDINYAACKSEIKVTINWAKTGHSSKTKSGRLSRHSLGTAVDISQIDGYTWSNKENAKKIGILNKIENFVSNLKNEGYVVNSESGNDKAVLYFGFDNNHNNHIHVSNKSKISDDFENIDVEKSKSFLDDLLDKFGIKKLSDLNDKDEVKKFEDEVKKEFGNEKVKDKGNDIELFGYSLSDVLDKAKSIFGEDIEKMKKPLK